MPIPFGKAFSYGTFLQCLRSPGPNAIPGRPIVSRGHLQLSKDKPCNDALLNHTLKTMPNIFKVINMAGPHAFTDDNFPLEKSGWIKKTGSKRWQKKDRITHLQRPETLRHARTADLGVPMMNIEDVMAERPWHNPRYSLIECDLLSRPL